MTMINQDGSIAGKIKYIRVANEVDLPIGERLFVEIGEDTIVILNVDGSLYAVADLCTHDNGPLGDGDVEGCEIICPRHGARFNLQTGAANRLPAVKGIPIYPVRIVDGYIEVGLP
jgi:3-phenylpropionate/trans-cinnamate dioxygenase ferredoxin component